MMYPAESTENVAKRFIEGTFFERRIPIPVPI